MDRSVAVPADLETSVGAVSFVHVGSAIVGTIAKNGAQLGVAEVTTGDLSICYRLGSIPGRARRYYGGARR
jgi:hypothetical protein